MIEFLSSWAKNLSLAVIIVSILEMLLPNNKTKKYIKMVMGIYILFSIISPFIQNKQGLDWNIASIDDFVNQNVQSSSSEVVNQDSMDQKLKQMYQEQLQKDITNKLQKKGYEIQNCIVVATLNQEDDNGGIQKITLKVESKKQTETESKEEKSVENQMVDEIQKIKKVEISIGEKNEEKEKSSLSKTDLQIIRKFLMEEYGVSEKCLKIN